MRTDMAKKDKQKKTAAPRPPAGMGVVPPAGMNSTGMYPPPGVVNSQGIYPGMNSTGMFPPPPPGTVNSQGIYNMTGTTAYSGVVGAAPPAAANATGKKAKKQKKGKAAQNEIDKTKLTADQLAQLQLEEAIKESTDPSSRLRKLKSPLSVGGCLMMLAIFIVATTVIVFFVCSFMVDNFNPLTLAKDMLDKFGITQLFKIIGDFFTGLFSGGSGAGTGTGAGDGGGAGTGDGGEAAARILLSLFK